MSIIGITSKIRDYKIVFGNCGDFLAKISKTLKNKCYIIDENVWRLYKDNYFKTLDGTSVIVLAVNENKKSLQTVQEIYDLLIKISAKRSVTIVSLGGGIIQDITGFVASTIYRGVNWIYFPTTLLAQADSCIGSKTSLNYNNFKNLIGTFYPPHEIYIDTAFLKTQESADFYSGIGEMLKLHIIGGVEKTKLFKSNFPKILAREEKTLAQFIYASLIIKKSFIEEDEFDFRRRNLLNYGHCFGHAIEFVSDFSLAHGQAVVIGMILSNIIARERKILSTYLESFLLKELLLPALFIKPQKEFLNSKRIISALEMDKKRTGKDLALIMLTSSYGLVKVDDMVIAEVEYALKEFVKIMNL